MSPSRVNWGVLLILIGGTLLATNLDYLSSWVWWDLLRLWPVLLIAIGINLMFRKSRFRPLSYLSALLLLATFAYVVWLNGGLHFQRDYRDFSDYFGGRTTASVSYDDQSSASIKFDFDDGRIYYNTGSSADLMRIVSRSSRGGIGLDSHCDAGNCDIKVSEKDHRWLARLANEYNSGHHDWRCYLHPGVDYSLDFNLDDTEIRFFAQDLSVKKMNVEADYSNLRFKFGDGQAETRLDLKGRSNDVELYFPATAGIRLYGIDLDPDAQADLGVRLRDGALFTENYETAPVRFDVVANLDNSGVTVRKY